MENKFYLSNLQFVADHHHLLDGALEETFGRGVRARLNIICV